LGWWVMTWGVEHILRIWYFLWPDYLLIIIDTKYVALPSNSAQGERGRQRDSDMMWGGGNQMAGNACSFYTPNPSCDWLKGKHLIHCPLCVSVSPRRGYSQILGDKDRERKVLHSLHSFIDMCPHSPSLDSWSLIRY